MRIAALRSDVSLFLARGHFRLVERLTASELRVHSHIGVDAQLIPFEKQVTVFVEPLTLRRFHFIVLRRKEIEVGIIQLVVAIGFVDRIVGRHLARAQVAEQIHRGRVRDRRHRLWLAKLRGDLLALGDERFQQKCIDRIKQFQEEGRSILLVTHNADQVRSLCDRAIVLDSGIMIADGPANEALRVFREHQLEDAQANDVAGTQANISFDSVTTPSGAFEVRSGGAVHFDVNLSAEHAYSGNFMFEIFTRSGLLVSRSDPQTSPVNLKPGANHIGLDIAQLPLLDGVYDINLGIVDQRGSTVIAWKEQAVSLQVIYEGREGGIVEINSSIQ